MKSPFHSKEQLALYGDVVVSQWWFQNLSPRLEGLMLSVPGEGDISHPASPCASPEMWETEKSSRILVEELPAHAVTALMQVLGWADGSWAVCDL